MNNYELRMTNCRWFFARMCGAVVLIFAGIFSIFAQSTDQNFPTPIASNEISGRIAARDLGDARLTNYFYTFDGGQGDVFLNVTTTNFNGDIDVFTADNLRPLTKITVYADAAASETGRVFYLRQPLKLILRIEGRTPNDDAATFQIKFAGSFAASTAAPGIAPEPEVRASGQTDVRVNSVGTIIEVKPKLTPRETVAKVEKKPKETKPAVIAENVEKNDASEPAPVKEIVKKEPKPKRIRPAGKPSAVVVTDQSAVRDTAPAAVPAAEPKKETAVEATEKSSVNAAKAKKEADTKEKRKSGVTKPVPPSELANINLVILFKDGSKIERPMSEVLKFGVDQGILTVISKDGAIGRYSILDVEKMTVE